MTWVRVTPLVAVLALAPSAARAEGGRFEGDLGLSAETGASLGSTTAATLAIRGLYIATAGVYAEVAAGAHGYRLGAAGVEVRPLLIPRFVRNLEGSRDVVELTIDSLSLDLGASTRAGSDAAWLQIGGGLEVPFLGRYDGPFLAFHALRDLAPASLRGGSGGETRLLVTVGWRLAFAAHIVDAGDRSVR